MALFSSQKQRPTKQAGTTQPTPKDAHAQHEADLRGLARALACTAPLDVVRAFLLEAALTSDASPPVAHH